MGFLGGGGCFLWVLLVGHLVFEVSEVGEREGGMGGGGEGWERCYGEECVLGRGYCSNAADNLIR